LHAALRATFHPRLEGILASHHSERVCRSLRAPTLVKVSTISRFAQEAGLVCSSSERERRSVDESAWRGSFLRGPSRLYCLAVHPWSHARVASESSGKRCV